MGVGVCCANLKDNKALMKMGLTLVLVGHVNFLLGALVHGAVLRHITIHHLARTMVFAISNVIAIVAGLVGVVCGITAIVLSKNKKNRILTWVLLAFSFPGGLLSVASTLSLSVSMGKAIENKGVGLLTHCNRNMSQAVGSTITYECPFDPTRIYSTTIILWVPLIFMSIVEAVFCFHCFAASTSFLHLCPCIYRSTLRRAYPHSGTHLQEPSPPAAAAPPVGECDSEAEPAEQDELLDGNATEAQSWL
ncbi:transmembrane protein 54a isoform 1-T1 [Pholidichthys leucotaenia]